MIEFARVLNNPDDCADTQQRIIKPGEIVLGNKHNGAFISTAGSVFFEPNWELIHVFPIKTGDRLRFINGTQADLFRRPNTQYKIGDIVESCTFVSSTKNFLIFEDEYWVCVNQYKHGFPLDFFELVYDIHKCHCPIENFYLTGKGCVCGGI